MSGFLNKNEEKENSEIKKFLINEVVSYASVNGLNMLTSGADIQFIHTPITLLPQPFPKKLFKLAVEVAPFFNELVDRIARDEHNWLEKTLTGTIQGDDFTKQLLNLHLQVESHKKTNPLLFQDCYLGVHRSDYMINESPKRELLQVELNTIASSFGCLATRLSSLHRFLCERYPELVSIIDKNNPATKDGVFHSEKLPTNNIKTDIGKGIALATEYLSQKLKLRSTDMTVLFIVQENERNSFDQRFLEYELYEVHNLFVMRRTMKQIYEQYKYVTINGYNNVLEVDGKLISVAYFRSGYTPNDYKSYTEQGVNIEWESRKLIEFSFAVKCPCVAYHLAGTKKVQQKLAKPGQLELFFDANNEAELYKINKLKEVFAGLWSLDHLEQTSEDIEAEEKAKNIDTCVNYVMKPQREGGGYNYYGRNVATKLLELPEREKSSFILMQRIFPKTNHVHLLRNGELKEGPGMSELGIFGVYIGCNTTKGPETLLNSYGGHLLKTKFDGVDEGGVAAGFACLGTVMLTE